MISSRLTRRSALALLLGLAALPALAAPHPRPIPIAEARALQLGTVVTVEGSVTTPAGAFASSFFDQGFGLQDRSGGLYVSIQENLGVAPRRLARVTGTLAESFGLLILVPESTEDVRLLGRGPNVRPVWLPTSAISEATEGILVRVIGTFTRGPESDLPFGYKIWIDDGSGETLIFINVETGIDITTLAPGQVASVTGFSSQFATDYEIDPRSPADIVIRP